MLVEVIACSAEDIRTAQSAGADRVELCLAIEVGGLTPYLENIEENFEGSTIPIAVMVRPRPGGFVGLTELILQQIGVLRKLNLPNMQVVTGSLLSSGELDVEGLRRMRLDCSEVPLVCHRCFDLTPDPFDALEQLIDLGFDRVLTSGKGATALEGADVIARLVEQANGRIEILAGSGIRPHNVGEIIRRTGVTQVHASCFGDAISHGGPVDFGLTLEVSGEKVRILVDAAKS